jgi:DNA-binding transcriptional LysR family regulator
MDNARLRRYFRHGMFPQLIAFEACIRHGSVTRAAQELSLAQPTVSCLIKKLSDTLGGPVTMSRDRRIEPTPLGVELLALCHELFDAFDSFDSRRPPEGAAPPDAGGETRKHGAQEPIEL